MSYNFVKNSSSIRISGLCKYDNTGGYESDFSINGEFDGWDYYSGIHTYGCWGGFLFGTLWNDYGVIGRDEYFYQVPAETHYFVKIAMKVERSPGSTSSKGKVAWKTLSNTVWDDDKSLEFDLIDDNKWNVYILNIGMEQWWQGYIVNMRVYPIIDGSPGDTFFIKYIKIVSESTYRCTNSSCDYFSSYVHDCPGVGSRGTCTSIQMASDVYTVSGTIIVDINGYGNENIFIEQLDNVNGEDLAKYLEKAIASLDIGGYAEVQVDFNSNNSITIKSGTYGTSSSVVVKDTSAARSIGFFDESGNDISVKTIGTNSASGYAPYSSFILGTTQLFDILDDSDDTYAFFDCGAPNVEGGRRDILESGLGAGLVSAGVSEGVTVRLYSKVSNYGKTLIDLSNPFNASGRINLFYAACTMDTDYGLATGCKLKIFRPSKGGTLRYIQSIDIPERGGSSTLQSTVQEFLKIDCDFFVNKGDFIGIFNADVYVGKSRGGEIDATYVQISGDVDYDLSNYSVYGSGLSGFSFYACSNQKQEKIAIDVDFGNRYNIENVILKGETLSPYLEYNIARCKDIDWNVDLFDGTHITTYFSWTPMPNTYSFTRPNVAYGINRLNDGIYIVDNNKAADAFSVQSGDTQPGVVPSNPYYFYVNGDCEWLGIHLHNGAGQSAQSVREFENDPIAIYIEFPNLMEKYIYKSKMYFKETNNFRSFGLSYFSNEIGLYGNADDPHYDYIPAYTSVTLNGLVYEEGMDLYDGVSAYLFNNHCNGEPIFDEVGITDGSTVRVINSDEYEASVLCDWSVIEHKWEPISCKGFRVYCDYHRSTKITEMELYCVTDDVGSSLGGSISVLFSDYGDLWSLAKINQIDDESVDVFIGDSPRYLRLEIEPVTSTKLKNIMFNISDGAVFIGNKGCEYSITSTSAKIGSECESQIIPIKNIYGSGYNLLVDIANEHSNEEGIVFHSRLNDEDSVSNPVIGADAVYHKSSDCRFYGQDRNCAINCDCYGLKNILAGKQTYISYNNGYDIIDNGVVSGTESFNISNINYGVHLSFSVPILYSDRYWKIVWKYPTSTPEIKVREMIIRRGGVELSTINYFETTLNIYMGPLSNLVTYLRDGYVSGSYCSLKSDDYIGFDLGAMGNFDELILFHDYFTYTDATKLTLSILSSPDNVSFGHYTDIALNTDSSGYYSSSSFFNKYYNTYFIVDLGHRHLIDIVRSYGSLPISSFSASYYTDYSTDDVSNYDNATFIPELYQYESADNLYTLYGDAEIEDEVIKFTEYGVGYLTATHSESMNLYSSDFTIDLWYKCSKFSLNKPGQAGNTIIHKQGKDFWYWYGGWRLVCNQSGILGFEWIKTTGSIGYETQGSIYSSSAIQIDTWYHIAVVRHNNYISLYLNGVRVGYGSITTPMLEAKIGSTYIPLTFNKGFYSVTYTDCNMNKMRLSKTAIWTSNFTPPDINSYYVKDDYTIVLFQFDVLKEPVRWIRIKMRNGDNVSRTIRKIGIYPDISVSSVGGNRTCEWEYLGKAVTNYGTESNSALNKTVTTSSYFGLLAPDRITDGFAGEYITQIWGSDSSSTQWIKIDLDEVLDVYKFKMYHGYMSSSSLFLAYNYNIQISEDDETYTTIFTITGNTQHDRLHELSTPVSARYVKINITSYNPGSAYVHKGDGIYGYFSGVAMREIEVYADYGYELISSEDYPIICIDLKNQFYIDSHNLIGQYSDSTTTDWSNDANNFSYSDNVVSVPEKVSFYGWGSPYVFEKWVAIKMNTATNLNSGPHYLKHAIIKALHGIDSYTKLLIHQDRDVSWSKHKLTFNGNSSLSSDAPSGFTGSITFDGSGDYISFATHDDFNVESEDFTIDCWFKIPNVVGYKSIFASQSDYILGMFVKNDKMIYFAGSNGTSWNLISGDSGSKNGEGEISITPNIWHHVAFVRNGSNWYGFIDGKLDMEVNGLSGTVYTKIESKNIGRWGNGLNSYMFNGNISEFRFSKGIARWTDWFFPRTFPYHESEIGLNPVEYHWWWRSTLSNLSNDHINTINSRRSLKIEYPVSSGVDDVSFIEGDYFGNDEDLGMRDCVSFWIHIDDINKMDTDYGYFYFGNGDTPVKYMWNISALNDEDTLKTGWNNLFLRFKSYDDIDYSNSVDPNAVDVRVPNTINFKTIGMRFRGNGQAFNIRLDGFELIKNSFMDNCYINNGLYLVNDDYLTSNISGLTLSRGTIEFFLRPDFNPDGSGYFNDFYQRCLFVMKNLANDYFGAYVFYDYLNIYFGNLNKDLRIFQVPISGFWEADEIVHIGITYSNNGTSIDSDGSTIRVYVYGALQGKCFDTWDVNDDKKVIFYLGGKMPFSVAQKYHAELSSIDGVVSELKIHNVCKTDFNSSIDNVYADDSELLKPSNFVKVSKDNLTFYSIGDTNLPLIWNDVQNNEIVPVYVKTSIPFGLTGREKRTAGIIVSWEIGV